MFDDPSQYEFGPYQLEPSNRLLTRNGDQLRLPPRVFDILVTLVRLQGRVVTKEELLRAVWGGSFVEESNLTVAISVLRKILNDGDGKQRYVQTVSKHGYRFVGEVRQTVITQAGSAELAGSMPSRIGEHSQSNRLRLEMVARKPTWVIMAAAVVLPAALGYAVLIMQRWNSAQTDQLTARRVGVLSTASSASRGSGLSSTAAHVPATPALASESARGEQHRADEGRPRNEVLALYLKGRYSWSRGTERGLKHSIAYFTNAIDKDPTNALAYAGLADAYGSLPAWSVLPPGVAYRRAKEAASRAVELDESLPQAHVALGMVALIQDWNFALAEQEFRRAVELGPSDSHAHYGLGTYLAANSRLQDSVKEMRIARDLDPLSLDIGMSLGLLLYYSRQYADAIVEYKKVIDLDPHYSVAHYFLGATYFVQQDFERAIPELKESSRLVNDSEPLALGLFAAARARTGEEATARSVEAELHKRSRQQYISATSMAVFYIAMGQPEQALNWIEQMFHDHDFGAVFANIDPIFDPVHSDRRFLALLHQVYGRANPSFAQSSAFLPAPH
jgi:DNA-binding winged helix-turn-helix (wHTH) protein/Tfp pilus assembly protein PilF